MTGPEADDPLSTRVTLVSQFFPPEPVPIPLGLTRCLRRQGFKVDVLTGMPNYPTGVVHPGYAHRRSVVDEVDGLRVLRTPLHPSHDRSAVGRAANYLSWATSSTLLGSSLLRTADVALVYSSPATAATAALAARLRWGIPYVLMVMDLWPDSVFATGFVTRGLARRVAEPTLSRFTELTYRRAAHVTVPSPGLRDTLVARGVPAEKVSVVYNWADEKLMQPTEPDPHLRAGLGLSSDDFVVLYGGNHGPAQDLGVAIAAMGRLRDLTDLHLVLVGDGVSKPALRTAAAELGLRTVHFVDPVAPERMAAVMAAADIQLVSLADQPLFQITMPSKVQTILACGQPILSCAPGDAARAIRDAGAGFTTAPGDPQGLAQTIRLAHATPRAQLRAMGRAGLDHYRLLMSEAANVQVLAELLAVAAKDGGRPDRKRVRR
ncbi:MULTISPECIES: glycosyltransferase family 4 protein [unclassified Micromonospora]|uniref:glycosyltransferase family 4 protein n=1 Tax=unclassified Micromonospora TaxID=2617518 RepID=UPI0022B634F9|nr:MULTISPECIES: glycosyltransferase family 4 protein [unclassified Micromonospora]MCZ7419881.1 glycosyltransferase family 4 protein [Verrucosispora sp. WMMA2121]WBB89572.1 glycosyltransferase family 4 protein [Verrucosispora sp. WMMC514]